MPAASVPQRPGDGSLHERRLREEERLRLARASMTEGSPGWGYLLSRGFTGEEIRRFGFGYEAHAKAGGGPERGRVTIPWVGCPWYHTDRAIGDAVKGRRYLKPPSSQVGPQPLFNEGALDGEVAFIVEGPLDAYAIEAVGGDAIALAGTSWRPVASAARGRAAALVALLDADDAGRRASSEMVRALRAEGATVREATLPGGAKDACELLASDRPALASFVREVGAAVRSGGGEAASRAAARMEGLGVRAATDVAFGIAVLADPVDPRPTGLPSLDDALGGGLRPGINVIGAAPSVGKTTLATQIADNAASAGTPVLYVTLEQTSAAIVAKGLSRRIRVARGLSVPASELLSATARSAWDATREEALAQAGAEYARDVAGSLWVMDASSDPTPGSVRDAAEALAASGATPPLVVVDYLQLLARESGRAGLSDKQAVDQAVGDLRDLAADLAAPLLVVSSLNRAGYAGRGGQRAFKESGLIEYAADLLVTLEAPVRGTGATGAPATLRPVDARVLKNREGPLPANPVRLLLDCRSSLFLDPSRPICATSVS